jgi:hypothetical protein
MKVKNHQDFSGYVYDEDLSLEVLDALKHKVHPDGVEELEVTGEFDVTFDDCRPYVTLIGVGIAAGNEYLELDLDDENFDFDDLVEQIEMDDSMNYNEYMAGIEDYYADLALDK